jgi:cell division protease FtsH
MGGRVAEKIIFSEMTNDASTDIKSATKIVKKMVYNWGMNPLGPVAYGENQNHIFRGRETSSSKNYSKLMAQKIDSEVIALFESGY